MAYYKDLNIEFETQNNGDIKTDIDEYAVINSIDNIIETLQGNRRMLPTFANSIHYLLFEPIDEITAGYIKNNIIAEITKWDSRVIIKDIIVTPNYDKNLYTAMIEFKVSNLGIIKISKLLFKG